MMKLREFKFFLFLFLFGINCWSQNYISGYVYEKDTEITLEKVEVYDIDNGLITTTSSDGFYEFETIKKEITLVFIANGYQFIEKTIILNENKNLNIYFSNPVQELSEVIVKANNRKVFQLRRLKDVEGTAIFAGKKS